MLMDTLSTYTFVALDLETTGLDIEKNAIIEIAAIKFKLSFDGIKYTDIEVEERSMLLDPEVEISKEVTMITGIHKDMIRGKSKWKDIQEKVSIFVGDAVIIGHNVLFDISVLARHGLDLRSNTVIDTFELSEMLSQDIESLNLGFLCDRYELGTGGEHRALDDTRMSIRLFLYYLGKIQSLEGNKKFILPMLLTHDKTTTIQTVCEICKFPPYDNYTLPYDSKVTLYSTPLPQEKKISSPLHIVSLYGIPEEEVQHIKRILGKHSPALLVAEGKKQIEFLKRECTHAGIRVVQSHSYRNYISLLRLSYMLSRQKQWPRKYLIFIGKLLFWLEDTKTGLLSELKYYGEEYEYLDEYRASAEEEHIFFQNARRDIEDAELLITDIYDFPHIDKKIISLQKGLIIRDVAGLESSVRNIHSKTIEFGSIYGAMERILQTNPSSIYKDLLESIRWQLSHVESIFWKSVIRPDGPDLYTPGEFGETYHLTQVDFWHRGGRWICLSLSCIQDNFMIFTENLEDDFRREIAPLYALIKEQIHILSRLIEIKDTNVSLILMIQKDMTKIHLIPRDVTDHIDRYLNSVSGSTYGYGGGIGGPIMQNFIKKEIYSNSIFSNSQEICTRSPLKLLIAEDEAATLNIKIQKAGTSTSHIVLTTSLKHTRELGMKLLEKYKRDDADIFIQGLSGGKGKILSKFLASSKTKIIIGLIDTWKDEFQVWERAGSIYLMKLPFDPPTDPRFLARTVGMKNNFESYSIPMTIIKINTLFFHIYSSKFRNSIYCFDTRLTETVWGKKIYEEIL